MKRAMAMVVVGLAFLSGFAAKEYTETFAVDKAKCRRILILISETEIKADCYWDLVDANKRTVKENVRTVCGSVVQTNAVTYNDIKTYVAGPLKDHYKAQKQLFSGKDE